MKTVLFITARFPYPIERGDKLRAYHQIRALSAHARVVLVAIVEGEVPAESMAMLEPHCERVHLVRKPRWTSIAGVLGGLLRGIPMQVGYFRTRAVQRRISEIVAAEAPDRMFCQIIRTAFAAPGSGIRSTLDYQDSMSAAASRRSELARFPLKQFWRMEADRLLRYEQKCADWFAERTIISEQDRSTLPAGLAARTTVLGNGLDADFFSPDAAVPPGEIPPGESWDIGFIGNLGYPPNVTAVKYLASEVQPRVAAMRPGTTLLIAGARPTRAVEQLASDSTKVLGWVDDIRTAYAATRVMLAPLFMGAGQQNKVLEAMAMGVPVVTTDLVNNAIGAKVGHELLVASSAEEFAEQAVRLLEDEELHGRISANALDFVRQNFDWAAVGIRLASILGVDGDSPQEE